MRFVSITMQLRETAAGVVIYYAAVDTKGRAWWWDTNQPNDEWKPLPAHPDSKT